MASALAAMLVAFAAGGLTVALYRHAGRAVHGDGGAASGRGSLASVKAAATARQHAATWVAAQVSRGVIVSCDPLMCSALAARGFPAGDLLALGPAASDPLGWAVMVSTSAVRSQFGSRLTTVYAPTVIASFGSGSTRIDIRVYAPGGAAAYLAALRADQRSRQEIGHQLLRNPRVSAAPAARRQLAAGQVDSRLLMTIATLTGQDPVRIVAFDGTGPGAGPGTPLRTVQLASPFGARNHGLGSLQSVLALLQVQVAPFRPASAKLARLADGQVGLRIEFAAPSPLGLLGG